MIFIGTLFATGCGIVVALFSNSPIFGMSIAISGALIGIVYGTIAALIGCIRYIIGEVVHAASGTERVEEKAEKCKKQGVMEMLLGIGFGIGVPVCSIAIAHIIVWGEAVSSLFGL